MKPKPFFSLNHFTVPLATLSSPWTVAGSAQQAGAPTKRSVWTLFAFTHCQGPASRQENTHLDIVQQGTFMSRPRQSNSVTGGRKTARSQPPIRSMTTQNNDNLNTRKRRPPGSDLDLETIASPATLLPGAVSVGTTVTGRAPFRDLDRVNQLLFLLFPWLHAQNLGLGLDLSHGHVFLRHALWTHPCSPSAPRPTKGAPELPTRICCRKRYSARISYAGKHIFTNFSKIFSGHCRGCLVAQRSGARPVFVLPRTIRSDMNSSDHSIGDRS